MSNLQFNLPHFSDDEDLFSFGVEAPNSNYQPLISPDCVDNYPSLRISKSQKFSQNSSKLKQQGYPLLMGQYSSDIQAVQQVAEGSTSGHTRSGSATIATTTTTTMIDFQAVTWPISFEIGEGSTGLKIDHNFQEKQRRMKLNAAYSALRSLLPESPTGGLPKDKWNAPQVVDKAIDYISMLQSEIGKLTRLKKNYMLSVVGKKQVPISSDKTLTMSINEVKHGELIVQICEQTAKTVGLLSTLIERLEGHGIQVLGASCMIVCEDRSCFHLHIQVCNCKPS